MASVVQQTIEKWHALLAGKLPGGLDELIADECVFDPPVVFTAARARTYDDYDGRGRYVQRRRSARPRVVL